MYSENNFLHVCAVYGPEGHVGIVSFNNAADWLSGGDYWWDFEGLSNIM